MNWYDALDAPPQHEWWWSVEHLGHPAFYLRALLAGDFAPGRGPAPRHVLGLDGYPPDPSKPIPCGTCGKVPRPEDLEPIERATGHRGFLDLYRKPSGYARPWPKPTDPASCYLCSTPRVATTHECDETELVLVPVKGRGASKVKLCASCAKFKDKARVLRGRPALLKTVSASAKAGEN